MSWHIFAVLAFMQSEPQHKTLLSAHDTLPQTLS